MAAPASVRAEDGVTATRKADHIRINVEEDVAKGVSSGFERYRFVHNALPEIDLAQVDISTSLVGYRLKAPILISCMTGGVPEAEPINAALAETAQNFGFALGLGSARVLIERPEALPSFAVRKRAPDVPLLANLGAVQLNKGFGVDACRRIVELLDADVLVLHLNALQEALQPEGDTDFAGLLTRISKLTAQLEVPVFVKEIGWGIASDLVSRLLDAGVKAVDVAGAGGTSWSEVERHRMNSRIRANIAAAFADWGIATAEALIEARRAAPDALIFASGGVRNGIDVAKAIALGADLTGLAGPFLRAATGGFAKTGDLAVELVAVLRTAMFAIGAPNLAALRGTPRLVTIDRGRMLTSIQRLTYSTAGAREFIDITDDVAAAVRRSGARDGIVQISAPHTTAAVRINENEPLLIQDFQLYLERLAPDGDYRHNDLEKRLNVPPGEPRNGHAHLQHLLLSSSESIALSRGMLQLGRWQRLFLIELDSAREREVIVEVLGT